MDSYETIDLKEMVFLLLSHLKLIICTVLIGGILAFCISQFVLTPMYTAQTSLYINNAKDTSGEDRINQTDINASQQLVNTYIAIIKSNSVLDRVASLMGDGSSSRELSDIVSASQINSTQLLKITVNHADPEKAQKIANLMAVTVTEQIGNFVKGSSVEIIDYAKLPSNASSPNKKMNTAIGLLLGLILSVLFVVVRDLLDTKIRDSEELAKTFDVPVLGYIPDIINANGSQKKKKKKNGSMASIAPDVLEMELRKERIFGKETNFFVREAYKTLRTNITLSLSGTGCRTIAVSSSSPSEGKSTNCINIAASMAELGKKVLLVDCDMRKPMLNKMLEVSSNAGLSSLLAGLANREEVIFPVENMGIDIIPVGPLPPNPSELLGSARMKEFLTELAEDYDYILLDTPPVNVVTDLSVMANFIDGVILVVKYDYTQRDEIQKTVHQLKLVNGRVLGFVLSNIPFESKGKYSKYKYKYRRQGYYGNYYHEYYSE